LILSTERIAVTSAAVPEESFVGDVEHLARNHLLDDWDVQVARNLQHGVARDPGQH
jgi:hypothetical protein